MARIANGVGEIEAETGVTPVGFDPRSFPAIQSGQPVEFTRDPAQPNWAILVRPR